MDVVMRNTHYIYIFNMGNWTSVSTELLQQGSNFYQTI